MWSPRTVTPGKNKLHENESQMGVYTHLSSFFSSFFFSRDLTILYGQRIL